MMAPRIGVILAGGGARRLGGADKGETMLAGVRLLDRVFEKLAPQVDQVIIAGPHDYATGIPFVKDSATGPAGPAAGLFAVTFWLRANEPKARGFITAPVDAPFLPNDLAQKLSAGDGSAIARCAGRRHPTFAYWDANDLSVFFETSKTTAPALHEIAAAMNAREVEFENDQAFFNVNTPEDLATAEALIAAQGGRLTP